MQLSELVDQARRRFGELLRELCEASALSQGKLSRLAEEACDVMVDEGRVLEGKVSSLAQPTLSLVMAGKTRPGYFQVYIWLHVLRAWYEGPELAALCKKRGVEVPVFSHALECDLWHLAGYATPTEIEEAYVIPVPIDVSLVEHKGQRFGRV